MPLMSIWKLHLVQDHVEVSNWQFGSMKSLAAVLAAALFLRKFQSVGFVLYNPFQFGTEESEGPPPSISSGSSFKII